MPKERELILKMKAVLSRLDGWRSNALLRAKSTDPDTGLPRLTSETWAELTNLNKDAYALFKEALVYDRQGVPNFPSLMERIAVERDRLASPIAHASTDNLLRDLEQALSSADVALRNEPTLDAEPGDRSPTLADKVESAVNAGVDSNDPDAPVAWLVERGTDKPYVVTPAGADQRRRHAPNSRLRPLYASPLNRAEEPTAAKIYTKNGGYNLVWPAPRAYTQEDGRPPLLLYLRTTRAPASEDQAPTAYMIVPPEFGAPVSFMTAWAYQYDDKPILKKGTRVVPLFGKDMTQITI